MREPAQPASLTRLRGFVFGNGDFVSSMSRQSIDFSRNWHVRTSENGCSEDLPYCQERRSMSDCRSHAPSAGSCDIRNTKPRPKLHSSALAPAPAVVKTFCTEGFKGRVATHIERIQLHREAPWTRSARTARVSI